MKVLLAVITILCFAVIFAAEDYRFVVPGLLPGYRAPTVDGEWLTKDGKAPSFEGKLLVLDFGFDGCSACHKALPPLNALAEKHAGKIIVVSAFLDKRSVTEPLSVKYRSIVFMAGAKELSDSYRCERFPTIFLIKDNVILWKGHGKDAEFNKIIEEHK